MSLIEILYDFVVTNSKGKVYTNLNKFSLEFIYA